MESGGKRGGDIGGYMWENQKVQGPSINKQITVCQDSRDLCALIFAHAAKFNHGDCLSNAPAEQTGRPAPRALAKAHHTPRNPLVLEALEQQAEAVAGTFNVQELANTMWAYATKGREPGEGVMRELEGRVEAVAGTLNVQELANTLWAYATMGREPGAGVMRVLEGQAEAVAGTFKAQEVANMLGREPGAGVMRVLEGQAEAVAGTFKAQEVANMLGREPGAGVNATMGREPGAWLMRVLEGRAEAVAGTFNSQNVTNMPWAYATMGRKPGAGVLLRLSRTTLPLILELRARPCSGGRGHDGWGWVEADFAADLDTRRSHTGYDIMMNGGRISWKSVKQKSMSLTSQCIPEAALSRPPCAWRRKI